MRLSHLVGAALGTGFLFLDAAGGSHAYDHRERDHWRHEEWRRPHRHENRSMQERPVAVRERPVYVERERPVYVERTGPVYSEPPRPVFVQPAPMYATPMYQQNLGPSGLNLNFNIPLN